MKRRSALVNDELRNQLLQRIARYLMLHGSFCNDVGLLNGKTGLAIFFYHYARYTGKKIYDDFAGELIDEIYQGIHSESPLNFEKGLCGIAWGIEYLVRSDFVKADPDEILEELDKRITEWDVRRITDCSLSTGLTGIGCYVIDRMKNRKRQHAYIGPDYIGDLIKALKRNKKAVDPELIETLEDIAEGKTIVRSYNPVFRIVDQIKYHAETIFDLSRSLGIDKSGYAGIGLQLMEINRI